MQHKTLSTILTVVMLTLAASATSAQPGMELGIRGGLSMSGLGDENSGFVKEIRTFEDMAQSYSDNYEAKSLSGFEHGAFVTFNIGTSFAVQPEFLYSKRGVKIEGQATTPITTIVAYYPVEETLELTYIQIPVLLKYRLPMKGNLKPALFAGPALAFNVSGTDDFYMRARMEDENGNEFDHTVIQGNPDISNIKSPSLEIVLGADVKLEAGSANFILDVRYTLATGNAFDDVTPSPLKDFYLSDDIPAEMPVIDWDTGTAPDRKNRVCSITLGVSVPM